MCLEFQFADGTACLHAPDRHAHQFYRFPAGQCRLLLMNLAALISKVHQFHQTASLAKNGTENFDYTVTALKELELEQWGISASGFMQAILQVETGAATGIFTDKDYLYNSTGTKSLDRSFKRAIKVAAGVKVRIVFENWENQSQTLQGFINGLES